MSGPSLSLGVLSAPGPAGRTAPVGRCRAAGRTGWRARRSPAGRAAASVVWAGPAGRRGPGWGRRPEREPRRERAGAGSSSSGSCRPQPQCRPRWPRRAHRQVPRPIWEWSRCLPLPQCSASCRLPRSWRLLSFPLASCWSLLSETMRMREEANDP